MTPLTPHPRVPASPAVVRRVAAVVVSAAVLAGAPLVAHAVADDARPATAAPAAVTPAAVTPRSGVSTWFDLTDLRSIVEPLTRPAPGPAVAPAPDPALVAVALVMDSYAWDERSPRVVALQEQLGLVADGWYAHATLGAHRAALQWAGLPTDHLPVAPVPAGPSPAQWAALRDCESNGNYSITNPSGRYRGAYQFDRSTWNSVASRHAPHLVGADPAAAAPADQDAMALALYGERGWRPWPHCGRHLR